MTPTRHTLAELRRDGYRAEVVERYCSFTRRRHDFMGCVDVLAYHPDINGVMGVQCTTAGNLAARVEKVLSLGEPIIAWLQSGNRIECWGWRKFARPVAGKRWRVNRRVIVVAGGALAVANAADHAGAKAKMSTIVDKPRKAAVQNASGSTIYPSPDSQHLLKTGDLYRYK